MCGRWRGFLLFVIWSEWFFGGRAVYGLRARSGLEAVTALDGPAGSRFEGNRGFDPACAADGRVHGPGRVGDHRTSHRGGGPFGTGPEGGAGPGSGPAASETLGRGFLLVGQRVGEVTLRLFLFGLVLAHGYLRKQSRQ